jgi:hypothetical protein
MQHGGLAVYKCARTHRTSSSAEAQPNVCADRRCAKRILYCGSCWVSIIRTHVATEPCDKEVSIAAQGPTNG